ncbi:MAG: hypothetical protein JKX93_17670 [Rhizobiaceae bacterium]|nr:hypothetical protein [Rhizobiaceae bacterium]
MSKFYCSPPLGAQGLKLKVNFVSLGLLSLDNITLRNKRLQVAIDTAFDGNKLSRQLCNSDYPLFRSEAFQHLQCKIIGLDTFRGSPLIIGIYAPNKLVKTLQFLDVLPIDVAFRQAKQINLVMRDHVLRG